MDTARTKNYLTVDAVGKMSTYELRQEAEKRGLLEEIPIVNHAALLRRLVQVIVEEENTRGRQMSQRVVGPSWSEPDSDVSEKERLRKERSDLKAAAIERSKQRQVDGDYFLAKKQSNARNYKQQPSQNQQPAGEVLPLTDEEKDVGSLINPRRHKVFVR